MSRNTHCQALLQRNKHNEQQSHIHVILRNLGNQPGKTPMWGNPKREILLASGKYISSKITFSSQENHLQTQSVPQTCCLENRAKSVQLYVVLQEASPPHASKPWSSIQAGVSRKLRRKRASEQIWTLPGLLEAPCFEARFRIVKRASKGALYASKDASWALLYAS